MSCFIVLAAKDASPDPHPIAHCFSHSLQDSDIQKKIDYEIRMRDGACKLLAACSQREQALEAAKSLVTCNARIMAYMAELQKMKEAQVMQRMARRYCRGRQGAAPFKRLP